MQGGRASAAEARFREDLGKGSLSIVRSLRRAPEEPDWSCWLSEDGWWLSVAQVPGVPGAGLPPWRGRGACPRDPARVGHLRGRNAETMLS
jgi:hypothetical protein